MNLNPVAKALASALLLLPLLGAAPVSTSASTPGSLTLQASLKTKKLPQQTDGETFLRVTVHGEAVHSEQRVPMNVALVIDRSGSMAGTGPKGTNKMQDAKTAAKGVLDQLSERDHFAVISFDNGSEVLATGEGTPDQLAQARARIDQLTARGGTDMISGLSTGLSLAKAAYRQDRTNRVILISDGVPNSENGLVEMARAATKGGVQTTTIGVGTDYNENLMSKIADAGAGNYYFLNDGSALAGVLSKELKQLMAVVGREAQLKIQFASGVKPLKVYGYDAKVNDEEVVVPLGDLFGGQTAEVLVKVRHPKLEGDKLVARVDLGYFDALAKADRKSTSDLMAAFVGDPKAVTASLDKDTAAKAEKIAAAEALTEASEELRKGNREEAKRIIHAQNQANAMAQASLGRAAKDTGGDALMDFESQLAAPAAAAPAPEVMVKAAKMNARSISR